jgi:hypothetical protein
MAIVRHYVESSNAQHFVETGTFLGSMVEYIAKTGVECSTIEIDEEIYQRTSKLLARIRNIQFLKGDSAEVLPVVLENIKSPAVFWLDGHYSGGFTGKADIDTPVSIELDMILNHPVKQHVVLIDDARDFNGSNGYPTLTSIFGHFDDHPYYQIELSADILRIVPTNFDRH